MVWTVAVIAIALAARAIGGRSPIWFDETFSLAIAAQPNFARVVDWCRDEIGGPAYYMLLWGWAQLFGTSTLALRSLSVLASLAAPALILWRGHPDRRTRAVWAALLLLWLPLIDQATNARCYALAILVATAQAIAFRRLIEVPDLKRAFAWTSASAALILFHAYGAAPAVTGGLLFLAIHRRRAVACWPALVALVPLALWFAWQLTALTRFATEAHAYPGFGLLDLALAPAEFFDSLGVGVLLTVAPLVTLAKGWRAPQTRADRALAATGLGAIALLLAVALLNLGFAWRYATPAGPAVLFAVAIWVRGLEPRVAAAPALIVALFAASAVGRSAAQLGGGYHAGRDVFSFARPSQWLAAGDAHHLAFLWDSGTGAMSDPRRLGEVAGFMLREGGRHERVTVLRAPGAMRPAALVAAALARDPTIDSLLWVADPTLPGWHADPDAAMMGRRGWTCRDFGRAPLTMLTCRAPRTLPPR